MPTTAYVSVHDPKQLTNNGTLLLDEQNAARAVRRGCVLLPVDVDLLPQESGKALGGFVTRDWGDQGWLYKRGSGERGCPMLIQVAPERTWLHWAARVVSASNVKPDALRLAGDSAQGSAFFAHGVTPEGTPEWVKRQGEPGWLLTGNARVNFVEQGLLAVCLYGVAKDARVLWSAVSLASE